VSDPLFQEHRSRGYHPERPERLAAAERALDDARAEGIAFAALPARDATDDELARAHEPSYVESLAALSGRYAALDADTFVAPSSVAAARRAAGGCVALVEAMLEGVARRGVALVRPPGHHATRAQGMGFCLVNNAAIAAYAALARGVSRVAILDWDVHHGNGTQDVFWEDPRVLYASLHQFPFYPGTGDATEVGAGEGRGATLNVPLSAGADDAVYAAAFDRVVLPVLDEFRPELVLVSAGFDAHERDPLAGMRLRKTAYARMTRSLAALADRHAGGRIALLLEGGYDLTALEASLGASVRALAGAAASDEAATRLPEGPFEAEIARAGRAAREHWHVG
jgi:acetoin utilization deacetylase AcuC-like enzyme